ncbi:dephospho-CoA kinase [Flavobacterium sp. AG291]|uniref:dephospho-CoA kinase n=1 Tax=Flavobacterium sp. AG291 TaxID=2184000 RepID=UPI000E0C2121|nr:dephospho-CoA kinase [Flavobacterium sp. AG291]RDI04421.1 dephospho-CoA kinase [Flavobacterium sp. AG291]
MTKVIGLTGGIGSGKTTIANLFKLHGIPLYIADDEAKAILYTDEVIKEVRKAFGDSIMTDGLPDRAKLSSVVFKEPEKLQMLNEIIHPKVKKHFKDWLDKQNDSPFIIREAAILFESGSYKDCDKIILVTAPVDLRIERVMKRDGVSREKVLERINSQWSDDKKAVLSDFIIENTNLDKAKEEVDRILKILKNI